MVLIGVLIACALVLLTSPVFLVQWSLYIAQSGSGKIPRGRWWFIPWLGESLHFFYKSPDQFFRERYARFGEIYRTHILGSPTIITSTPEHAKFILATKHKSFKAIYPPSIDRVLNHPSWEGAFHQRIRKIVQSSMLSETIRDSIPKFESLCRWCLENWNEREFVVTHDETRKFAFHVALSITCSMAPCEESMRLLDSYGILSNGAISMPINFPGTGFHLAIKVRFHFRSEILTDLTSLVKRRKSDTATTYSDILGSLLASKDDQGTKFTDDEIRDILITFLFAGHETTAVFLVWIVKYLTEHPDILEQVRDEQDQIRSAREHPESPLTWSEIKNMPVSLRVVQESLRLANVAPFSPREVVEDVEHDGVLFPKGWKVQVYYRHFHLNPTYFKDPHKFDPSRFLTPPKPGIYTPFGNGVRLCPGSEVVKLEALIFIHLLVTNYKWKIVGGDCGVQYWPTPRPKGGLHLKVWKRSD
ncbi:hypothetical protein SELMODRAFT_120985 [Selaginella moellendorffii]|uniref:Uncharacterized protein CYP707B1 n=1 Tax=Selaginella moellendorffii TaxID=88036 RepID=D8SN83_SELML|nr:hypothetical protein SELMODRAFT_120985 [Selaginella moellendorffii]